jgi:asparagine synthase (glutamine-hydrolysing)
MCGILAVIGSKNVKRDTELAQKFAKTLSHRGPDESGIHVDDFGNILCHERLSIMDVTSGKQPIQGTTDAWMIHNGEIYNYHHLKENLTETKFRTKSDSEVIVKLWERYGEKAIEKLDGIFAFVVVEGTEVFVARDPMGIKPLYYGQDTDGAWWFASEAKALMTVCASVNEFAPGHYYTRRTGLVRYYNPSWKSATPTTDGSKIRSTLERVVKNQLMSDVEVGVLLSGGLDSSLISSIVVREMKKIGKKVKSFSVGTNKDAQDIVAARKVAAFLGTEHHEVIFSVEEGIATLNDIIHKLETYDITTIRASTPMYILSKYIAKQGIKVVLSGEGADEIFGGYLYFNNAPSAKEFHEETVRRVFRLHTADVLRADRSTAGAGVEARVPFLDVNFLDMAMRIRPEEKLITKGSRMEKFILREAFDLNDDPYLPRDILWRQKEQFSDGVGYNWIDTLRSHAETAVTDAQFARALELYPHNTPQTKEAFFYRQKYASMFTNKSLEKLVQKWVPKWQTNTDPSGRANTHHVEAYKPSASI